MNCAIVTVHSLNFLYLHCDKLHATVTFWTSCGHPKINNEKVLSPTHCISVQFCPCGGAAIFFFFLVRPVTHSYRTKGGSVSTSQETIIHFQIQKSFSTCCQESNLNDEEKLNLEVKFHLCFRIYNMCGGSAARVSTSPILCWFFLCICSVWLLTCKRS